MEHEFASEEHLYYDAFHAIEKSNLKDLKRAVERGLDPNSSLYDELDRTLFHKAVHVGHVHIVQYLTEKGANVNAKNCDGKTALHLAAKEGGSDVTEYLIRKGACVDARDDFHRTPLHLAKNKEVCRLLLENGADINAEDYNLWQPLHFAAMAGNEEEIQVLLEHGANVNAMDLDGNTPCHVAGECGELDSLKILLPFMRENMANGLNQTVFDLLPQKYGDQLYFKKIYEIEERFKNSKGNRVLLQNLPEPCVLDNDFLRRLHWESMQVYDDSPDSFINTVEAFKILQKLRTKTETNSKEEYLRYLLGEYAHPPIHWVEDGHPGCKVAVRVQNFVNYFLNKAAEVDPMFAGTVEPVGSCADGSKLGKTDEFDFLVAIEDLSHAELHFDDRKPGYVRVRLTGGEFQERWKEYLDQKNQLQAERVINCFWLLLWETSRRLKSLTIFGFSFRKVVPWQDKGSKRAVPLVNCGYSSYLSICFHDFSIV